MQSQQQPQIGFINPYRQNKRCFSKYFNKSYLQIFDSKCQKFKNAGFLDNMSIASSIKIKQNKFETRHSAAFLIFNRRHKQQFQNPQIFDLLSKHILEKPQGQKRAKKQKPLQRQSKTQRQMKLQGLRKADFLFQKSRQNGKIKGLVASFDKLQKTPKITQFSRNTFYRSNSSQTRQFCTSKQRQDKMHSKCNMEVNTKKVSLHKLTKSSETNRFTTYEIYSLNMRIGIDVQILGGSLRQIKFRLILNQSDTKTFNKFWKNQANQFVQKCLKITQNAIELRSATFNSYNKDLPNKNTNRIHKSYLQGCQSIAKKQTNTKLSGRKVANKSSTQQYEPIDFGVQKQIVQKQVQVNQNAAKQSEQLQEVLIEDKLEDKNELAQEIMFFSSHQSVSLDLQAKYYTSQMPVADIAQNLKQSPPSQQNSEKIQINEQIK